VLHLGHDYDVSSLPEKAAVFEGLSKAYILDDASRNLALAATNPERFLRLYELVSDCGKLLPVNFLRR
jgi:hypothetical protein